MKKSIGSLGVALMLLIIFSASPADAGPRWKQFSSEEQLASWLTKQPYELPLLSSPTSFEDLKGYCVYSSLKLQEAGLADGYLVGLALVSATHMANVTVIEDRVVTFEKLPFRGGYNIRIVGLAKDWRK